VGGASAPPTLGLPCLSSNNSTEATRTDIPAEVKEPSKVNILTGGHKRSAEVLATEIKGLAKAFGLERLGFLTLTFADLVLILKEANRRFNSLNTHVLKQRYERAIVVPERQKSGRVHFHLLVVMPCDIRTGCDFKAFARGDYRSANAALRAEWAFWRKTAPKYGFGRHELLPVKSNEEGIARYVGKYISKHVRERNQSDKGARLVRYLGFKPGDRRASCRFAWNNDNAWLWRNKLKALATEYRLADFDAFSRLCGRRWAWHLQSRILRQELHDVIYPSFACACREHPSIRSEFEENAYWASQAAAREREGSL
jgi:hypothetical protein